MRCLRSHGAGRAGALLTAVVVLAFGAAPAHALGSGSLDAAGTTIVAFADTHQPSSVTTSPFVLNILRQWYCSKPDRGRPLSLNAALAIARTLVAADSHGRGLQAFSRSRDGRKAATAIAAAAGALGVGKPAAALAALLRARQLAPRDPVPLIDAAPLLAEAGKGRAALALLDAAKRLKAPRTNPFGISWSALMNANRGQTLIRTGQYAQAEKTLAAALKAAPLLREASQNMGVAYDCQRNIKQAERYLIAAVRRQTFKTSAFITKPPPPPPPPPQSGQLDPIEVLDTSKGQALTLRTISFPPTLKEGAALVPWWLQMNSTLTAQASALVSQWNTDRARLNAQLRRANPATSQRTLDILSAVEGAGGEPNISALQRQAAVFARQMSSLQVQGLGGATREACLNPNLHGPWLSALKSYDSAQRRYAVALYRLETAFAANLSNLVALHVAMDDARQQALSNFTLIVAAAQSLSSYDAICLPPTVNPGPGSDPASGQNQTPASPPCPKGITGPDIELELLVFSLHAHCEDLTIRASTPTWLAPFLAVTHNFGNGSNTVFAGVQAGRKFNWGPLAGGATARAGVYVTFGADGGAPTDFGVRATASVNASVGLSKGPGLGAGGKIPLAGTSLSMSFPGAFTGPI